MSKKNKKIKYKCPHCEKRNTFAKINWKGEGKTKCKYCGKLLEKVKIYELPIEKIKTYKKNNPSTKEINKIVGPAKDIRSIKDKKTKGILFWIILSVFIFAIAFILDNTDINSLKKVNSYMNSSGNLSLIPPLGQQEICNKVTRVPSWIQNGEIIDIGYKEDWDVDYLIKNKIYFVYSSRCSACHKQIGLFGSKWARYIASGYAIGCF